MHKIITTPVAVAILLAAGSTLAFAQSHGGSFHGSSMHSSISTGSIGHNAISSPSIGGSPSLGSAPIGGTSSIGLTGINGLTGIQSSEPLAGFDSALDASQLMSGRSSTTLSPVDPTLDPNDVISETSTGGVSTQSLPGSSVGQQVPLYNTGQLSTPGLTNSINQSATRSSGTACNGQGQRTATIGMAATTTISGDCSNASALGVPSIMTGSTTVTGATMTGGAVDVSRP